MFSDNSKENLVNHLRNRYKEYEMLIEIGAWILICIYLKFFIFEKFINV